MEITKGLEVEYDGKFTISYITSSGDESAFRADPEMCKLINGSKDLLKACQIAVKAYEELGLGEDQNCYKQAISAIKKATK